MGAQMEFTNTQIIKMIEDIIKNLKDLYRIWLKETYEGVKVISTTERLSMGVIQYKLLEDEKFFNKLKKAVLNLNRNPNIRIERELLYSLPYEIEEISTETINSYISFYEENYGGKILAPKKIITKNTYENRFVKGTLIKILWGINELLFSLEEYKENLNKIKEYEEKIEDMRKKLLKRKKELNLLLNLEFINEIKPEFEIKLTPVIKNNPYYNMIYKLYLKFHQFCIPVELGELNLQSFDEWLLYELWVFFQILEKCKEKFGEKIKVKNFFEIEGRKIKLKIGEIEKEPERKGTPEIEWENFSLYYQKRFEFTKKGIGSYTIPVKPDIVLWNKNNNEIIIFDAKKETAGSLFKEKGARRSAIAQLHQYKESIINFKDKKRVVKGTYAIIPKRTSVEKEYEKFFDKNYRKEYGFGFYVFEVSGEKEEVEIWENGK